MKYRVLNNGIQIPAIGIGTWQITDREIMKDVIVDAYSEGYRLIDTAAAYSNEIALAKAIEKSNISREKLFITDKAWNTYRGYDKVQDACRKSLKKLKTDYLDAYLIHWPASQKLHSNWVEINAETWRGMEQLYKDGLVRAIGVCNFKVHHLEKLLETVRIAPMINQIEIHPGLNQEEIMEYCAENEIIIEASSPLGNGQILSNKQILEIAQNKRKTPAQICLRWEIQKGLIPIPKTIKRERLTQNMSVFDFELTMDEMNCLDTVPYCGGINIDSDEVTDFG